MKPRSTILLAALLCLAATPTPTLVQHASNVSGSLRAEAVALGTQLQSLEASSDRLQSTAGDRDSVLLLLRDVELTDRSAEILQRKSERFEELTQELEEGLRSAESRGAALD
jgi:prefoldin subunit 5